MGTYLVGAPGLQPDAQERCARELLHYREVGPRLARSVSARGDELAGHAIAPHRRVYRAASRRPALHERRVLPLELAAADQLLERPVHRLGLRPHPPPPGIAAQPADDAPPPR